MKDKFKTNFAIVVPAAIATVVTILLFSSGADISEGIEREYELLQMIPYVFVLVCGIAGVNVFITLLAGIVSGAVIMIASGEVSFYELISGMGEGASGMFETSMVAVLVAALCALIRYNGGFDALLSGVRRIFRGKRGGQLGIGLLVGLMDIATANNTVAIVMANPIARDMAKDYGISPRKAASLLDTFSCIFQGFLPYGAQILVALSVVHTLGGELSAFDIIKNLSYPIMLLLSSLVFIFLITEKRKDKSVKQRKE